MFGFFCCGWNCFYDRFEPDMLAFSGCYYGGGEKERYELGEIRKRWATLPVRLLSLIIYGLNIFIFFLTAWWWKIVVQIKVKLLGKICNIYLFWSVHITSGFKTPNQYLGATPKEFPPGVCGMKGLHTFGNVVWVCDFYYNSYVTTQGEVLTTSTLYPKGLV